MAPIPTPAPAVAEPNAATSTNALAPEEYADTSMPDATTHQTDPLAPPPPPPPSSHPQKRKRKDTHPDKQPHILHQSIFRKTTWSYFHLALVTPSTTSSSSTSTPTTPTTSLSPLLASSLLTAPLRAYLGTTGTAIPIDMLKLCGREIWVRIPRQDARGFRASLSGWVGTCEGDEIPGVETGSGVGGRVGVAWRVVGEGSGVLGMGGDGDGGELFG